MCLQYKEKSNAFDIDRCEFYETSTNEKQFNINFIFDPYPDMISIIMNSSEFPIPVFNNNYISFDFLLLLFQNLNSNNFSMDQKCVIGEVIDSIIINGLFEKNEIIFNLFLQFLSLNGSTNKVSKVIFKCIYDLISPNIIKKFPYNMYDIIKSTNDKVYISRIAQKISQNLTRKNKSAKLPFIMFLKEISFFVNKETALSIYTAHLNVFCVFPSTFPISSLDFYANATNFDSETLSTVLIMLAQITKDIEIFLNPQIRNAILSGITNKNSISLMIHSIHALTNFLKLDVENFKENYFFSSLSFQQLITYLNSLIQELTFAVKSDAGYFLSLLMQNFPQELVKNICGDEKFCDIRESIMIILDLDRPFLSIQLLYGLDSIFTFSLENNVFNQFYMRVGEYDILDAINNLATHTNQDVASTADIVYAKIYEKTRIIENW